MRGTEPGSPRHVAVVDKLQGQIGQVLRKNQQQVKLGGHEQYASTTEVPGGRIHYHNNQGQETVTVDVQTEGGGEEKVEENPEYWQWAIIETTIPDMTKTSAEMSAFMNPKPKPPLLGVAWDDEFNYDEDKPPLAYPDFDIANQINTITGQADQVSSLRVDLRPYPGGVKFDLYGYIHSYIDPDGHGPRVASTFRAGIRTNSIASGSWTGTWHSNNGFLSGAYPSPADISGRTPSNVLYSNTLPSLIQDDFPVETTGKAFTNVGSMGSLNALMQAYGASWAGQGPAYAGITQFWTPGSGNGPSNASVNASALIAAAGGIFTETTTYYDEGFTKLVRGIGGQDYTSGPLQSGNPETVLNGAGPDDSMGSYGITFFDYYRFHTSNYSALTVYPTRSAPIKFTVFDGEEPDSYTRLNGVSGGFGSRKRWEDSKRGVGNRWPMKQIAVANIRSIDAPVSPTSGNHFGMPKLGTVIINPRKGKGGIKFIAA